MNFLIVLLTFSSAILPLISSLILDHVPKFSISNINSNKPLDCILTNNKFYTVRQCTDFVGFVIEDTMIGYHVKVSHIVSVENDTFLLLPNERELMVIVNDDMDKFERYSIDLKDVALNLSFEKFSALKNGDFITFAFSAADFD